MDAANERVVVAVLPKPQKPLLLLFLFFRKGLMGKVPPLLFCGPVKGIEKVGLSLHRREGKCA